MSTGVSLREDSVSNVLAAREAIYGKFSGHAEISQSLILTMQKFARLRNKLLAPDQREALQMIAHKIARILNGDPNYADSWQDIAGYAQLVANRLQGDNQCQQVSKRSSTPTLSKKG